MLKKGKQRQYHAYARYFSLLRGFRVKLFVLIKVGGIYIFIKIESEIRIFDLTNSVKEKIICKCDLLKEQMKFGKKSFEILPPGFSEYLNWGILRAVNNWDKVLL